MTLGPRARRLADTPWPEGPVRPLVLVPVGSVEQHGPHLPLDTDTVIATAVAERVAAQLTAAGQVEPLVAPAVSYGASGEHQDFFGTASIGLEALHHLVLELVRSLSTWAGDVVLVNGHGGNVVALERAVRSLRGEGRSVAWVACGPVHGDAHAGHVETSLMLHLAPQRVRRERAEPGNSAPLRDLLPELVRDGVRAVSANGVLGDPTGASASAGALIMRGMVEDAVEAVLGSLHPVVGARA